MSTLQIEPGPDAVWTTGMPTDVGAYWMRIRDPNRETPPEHPLFLPYLVLIGEEISTRKPPPLYLWKMGDDVSDSCEDFERDYQLSGQILQFCGPLSYPKQP